MPVRYLGNGDTAMRTGRPKVDLLLADSQDEWWSPWLAPVDERGGLPRASTSQSRTLNAPPPAWPERLPREQFRPLAGCCQPPRLPVRLLSNALRAFKVHCSSIAPASIGGSHTAARAWGHGTMPDFSGLQRACGGADGDRWHGALHGPATALAGDRCRRHALDRHGFTCGFSSI